ncbi:MAG TPA: hypothetical protein VF292_15525, partial [Rhodanobacteraceae bacterium]
GRFVWCWWVVPFIAFSLISGKQIHYLLPLLPAWALAGAWLLQQAGARMRPLLFALLALIIAVVLAVLPWRAAHAFGFSVQPVIAVLALVPLVIAVGVWRLWGRDARGLALSATALVSSAMLAGALAYLPALDVVPEAGFVRQELTQNVAIAHIGWHNGLFGYTGRLHQPLPWIPYTQVDAWCRAHPDGVLLASDAHLAPKGVTPYRTWPYFLSGNHRMEAFHAATVLAHATR